jgi:NAD+ kinase
MKYFTIIHKSDASSRALKERMEEQLIAAGLYEDANDPELVIVLGGDGKMLRAIHQYTEQLAKVAFVGINTGTLGFHADYRPEEVDAFLEDVIHHQPHVEEHPLLEVSFHRPEGIETEYAINEFRIENRTFTVVIQVEVDGEMLEEFRGNGLCVSTPFGSSAYNRSLGGAIVMPELPVMQLSEIAGLQNNEYSSLGSSLLLGGSQTLTFHPKEKEALLLGLDHLLVERDGIETITVRLSDRKVRFARYRPHSNVQRLRRAFIRFHR